MSATKPSAQCSGLAPGGEAPSAPRLDRALLGFDVLAENADRSASNRAGKVGTRPQLVCSVVMTTKVGKLLA